MDRNCYVSRTYSDYQKYLVKHPDAITVQMDSVIGTTGGKVLLTIHFTNCNLMLAFLRDANTSRSITDIFEGIYEKLGLLYKKICATTLQKVQDELQTNF